MTEERDSLADQAAAWVPPWERPRTPHPDLETEAPGEDDPAAEAPAEAEPMAELSAEVEPVEPATEAPAEDDPAAEQAAEADPWDVAETQDPATFNESGPTSPAEAPLSLRVGEDADADADAEATAEVEADIGDAEDLVPPGPSDSAAANEVAPVPHDLGLDLATANLALIDEEELRGALEAILLVVDEPVQEIVLAQILEQPTERVGAALEEIAAGYTAAGHGFELRRAAGGWRLYTRPRYAAYVERFVLDGQSVRLTQAALETLAVVAYKQPVTRSRISAIRGVNCDGVIRTLTSRGLVEECGTEPESGAFLYRTTVLFLEKLGLDSVEQLPPLAPFLPDDIDEVADAGR